MSDRAGHATATATRDSPGEPALDAGQRLAWQQTIFAAMPERRALLALQAAWPLTRRRIRVHRNHAVEPAISLVRPFLEYAGIEGEMVIGDYDDSLSFAGGGTAEVEVVWLDYSRFGDQLTPAETARWLGSRLAALRARTTAPILLLDWDAAPEGREEFQRAVSEEAGAIAGVYLADRGELFQELGPAAFDEDRAELTGTRMSREAATLTARLLGSRWLPALLQPRLKAIALDLDNTLYDGVLGEDGPDGVRLTGVHRALQQQLRELRDSGLFLALVSRNEPEDVERLFEQRGDFPLRWDDFSARAIGWGRKSESLQEIADALRIDTGAVLFVDDNPGELLETAHRVARLKYLHAGGPADTVAALRDFPNLWSFGRTAEDAVRVADLQANEARDRALEEMAGDLSSYYRELDVRLVLGSDRPDQLSRVADLSGKTNQFNLAIQRYGEAQLRPLLEATEWQITTAALRDRLSDSGIIAMAVAERRGSTMVVHEVCVSCRALGRQLEDLIISRLLTAGSAFGEVDRVSFAFIDGPRNGPARTWLERFAGREIPPAEDAIFVDVDAETVRAAAVNPDVTIETLP